MKTTISYQNQLLPPPYAYAAVLQIEMSQENAYAQFDLEYLGRESVSDDELKSEGFTRADDFSWKGEISNAWKEDIDSFEQYSYDDEPNEATYLHIESNGESKGFPTDIKKAEVIFHELMQAILEKSKLESPLYLESCIEGTVHRIKWRFSERMIELNDTRSRNWEVGRELLNVIYSIDYETQKPAKGLKKNSINLGDGLWYELKKGRVSQEINRLIDALIS
ncbi:MAG: hypothetical protein ABJG47_14490 [Ekhidna sp.]